MKLHTHLLQLLADTKTPVGLYLALRDKYQFPLLLESSNYNSKDGHYSYLCLNPLASVSLHDQVLTTAIGDKFMVNETIGYDKDTLISKLKRFKEQFCFDTLALPFCYAGLFGYTAYDIIRYAEEIDMKENATQFDIPELQYFVYGIILVFDHNTNSLTIISHAFSDELAKEQLAAVAEQIRFASAYEFDFRLVNGPTSSISDTDYKALAEKAKTHCQLGDVFQLVLSRRFSQEFTGDDFNVYRALKNINPSPYLFYFDLGNFRLFGSSPEAQLVIGKTKTEIHPIAGTYKRTGNDKDDLEKAKELLADPKENAEHNMLVDLARNDLSKYCANVELGIYKQAQFYSHVIHLVSTVTGEHQKQHDPFEILLGTFPAGTLSGAPKYRALQLIDQYETDAREFYGGCIGFISHDNQLNHAIMIRTFLSRNNTLHYQAGAGIVVNSSAESELNEIYHKTSALRKSMEQAAQFNHLKKNQTNETLSA
jgi:anthranilate synthase component 1